MALNQPRPVHLTFPNPLVTSLQTQLQSSVIPAQPVFTNTSQEEGGNWELGVDYDWLRSLKERFINGWSVDELEKRINLWPNYMVRMKARDGKLEDRHASGQGADSDEDEEIDLHFMHVKSERSDAVPMLILHGWPGTFMDFHKIIGNLVNPTSASAPAFHVVAPSLPGYCFSQHPKTAPWSTLENARLFHRLMIDVLGYERYLGQGGDWGSNILRLTAALYGPPQVPLVHLNMYSQPTLPDTDPAKLTPVEQKALQRRKEFIDSGWGYVQIQSTKPYTIGLAIGAHPLSLLAYIGEKLYGWSDPTRYSSSPSSPDGLAMDDVLDTVALYYLTSCFASSVMIYHQSVKLRAEVAREPKWRMKSRIGYSLFPYEIGAWPQRDIAATCDLVFFKEHAHGGHFAALDNPDGLVNDLREFVAGHWPRN